MYNVEVMVEQAQCVSVYKEFALINEQPLIRINIVKNHSLLFFVLFQSLSNINNALLWLMFFIYFVCLYLIGIKTKNIKVMDILWR